MKLKEWYRRFRAWQQEPYRYEAPAGEEHICKNCGHSFQGKFCPVCGQKATIGRVSWKSVWTDFLSIWVTDSRSAVPSLLQLLGRPGFLIRDYLSGRRKVSYSPVSMLFLLALVVVVLRQLMSAGEGGVDLAILISGFCFHFQAGGKSIEHRRLDPRRLRGAPRHGVIRRR